MTDTSVLGIAFGTVLSVESGVILLCGVGIGQLRDHTGNYTASLWCLIGLATVGIIAAVALRTCGMSRSAKSGFG